MAVISGKSLLIIDLKKLRRAWLASYLKTWAEAHTLDIVTLDPSQVLEAPGYPDCRMIILNLGLDSLANADISKSVEAARGSAPDAALVILSDSEETGDILAAVEAGAVGFVSTDLDPDLALRAFSFILDGGSYFPTSAIRPIPTCPSCSSGGADNNGLSEPPLDDDDDASPSGGGSTAAALMTARQQEVLELLQLGQTNKHIARRLGMTEATAKVHVRHIMRKLGAANRTQAALCAKCLGPPIPGASISSETEREASRPTFLPEGGRAPVRA